MAFATQCTINLQSSRVIASMYQDQSRRVEMMAYQENTHPQKLAVVLIAHGSRNAEANADATYFAERLQASGAASRVVAGYLELAEPTIPQAVEMVLANEPEVVVLLPYFLSGGVHVRRDLADACVRFRTSYPLARFLLAEPIGRHRLVATILENRLRESLVSSSSA